MCPRTHLFDSLVYKLLEGIGHVFFTYHSFLNPSRKPPLLSTQYMPIIGLDAERAKQNNHNRFSINVCWMDVWKKNEQTESYW